MTTTPSPGAIALPVTMKKCGRPAFDIYGAEIFDANGKFIGYLQHARDAVWIARALNTHDRLMEELRRLSSDAGSLGDVLRVEHILAEAEGPTEQKEKHG